MRIIALVPAFLISVAFAAEPTAIDLDKPGVLDQLKQTHPQRYDAVTGVLRAWQQMPCNSTELKALQTRYDLRDVECNVLVLTSYPAKRHVSFVFDGTNYAATIVIKDVEDGTVQPAGLTAPVERQH